MKRSAANTTDRDKNPSVIFVEPTTRCNMRCAMCVKHSQGSGIVEGDMDMEIFRRLGPSLASCGRLIFSGIGEPALHPELGEMIRFARDRMNPTATIGLQSNGTLITRSKGLELVRAGLDTACLSVDAVEEGSDAQQGRLHRANAATASAFEHLRAAAAEVGRPLRLGVEFVLMRETFAQLPAVVDWAGEHGAQFLLVTHALPYSRDAEAQGLFNPNTDKAVRYFEKWKAMAQAEGLDVSDALPAQLAFAKTEPQKRLLRLMRMMREDAWANGVWTNLPALLEWDGPDKRELAERVRAAMERAETAALRRNLELTLPPLLARHDRCCEFAENPAAFVDWMGNVSPCHFLWHDFSCVMDGQDKRVRTRFFGSLADQDLLAIWNSPEFREFRKDASGYAYPPCSNCHAGLCAEIKAQNAPFEYDCFGLNIPCCHCPWPVGQMACLS